MMKAVLASIALLALQDPATASILDPAQVLCTSKAIYHEARGEPVLGRVAVAYVIKNRQQHEDYPSNACKVVYQPHQFTGINKMKMPNVESAPWQEIVSEATLVQAAYIDDPTDGATHYYSQCKIPKPKWAYKMTVTAVIGCHTFLKSGL